ncbi:hypothetical protein [Candidatus Paracaedibacter symbiosus]|uniref:hypothetical protein n=1 Tax=Candidatus Paracaedibacter symbiosus TaxID=244582 RepID=UPI00068995AC|nr:hypothetical protein [Candidatus Paracaedibacter symbiosus]
MKHNDHDPLEVGCICAGHMEGDLNAAESRDRELRARANRRSNWLSLLGWKVSKKENDYLRTRPNMTDDETHFIIITQSQFRGYSAIIDGSYLKLWYDNKNRAKLAAFDYLWPSKMSFS